MDIQININSVSNGYIVNFISQSKEEGNETDVPFFGLIKRTPQEVKTVIARNIKEVNIVVGSYMNNLQAINEGEKEHV